MKWNDRFMILTEHQAKIFTASLSWNGLEQLKDVQVNIVDHDRQIVRMK